MYQHRQLILNGANQGYGMLYQLLYASVGIYSFLYQGYIMVIRVLVFCGYLHISGSKRT